jgi:branched-chain amino acid transport system permease protein
MDNNAKSIIPTVEVENRKAGFFGNLVDLGYKLMDNKFIFYPIIAVLLALACLFPQFNFVDKYVLEIAWTVMFYMLLAMGLNVIVGYTGMFDFGYAAKFAVGAYTSAILVKTFGWSFWLTLPVTVITATIAACIIGGPTLRLRSDYLTIVTLGFGEITRLIARNLSITGSATGLSAIQRPYLFGLQIKDISHWYYVFLALVVLYVIISSRIKNSRFGRALEYIREDEDAAEAMGIDTVRYKLWAFIMGSILGGIAGSFYVMKMTAISPNVFQFQQSANIMLCVVLGGLGKIPGVMMGALFFVIFPEIFRPVAEYRFLIFGLLLVILMIFRPQGLWPERRR